MTTIREKIGIFALWTIAAISVAAVVLPSLLGTQMFSAPVNAEPFGQCCAFMPDDPR
jgi:hypothetical protein